MIFYTDVSYFLNEDLFAEGYKLCDNRYQNKISSLIPSMERCRTLSGALLTQYAFACYLYSDFLTRSSDEGMKECEGIISNTCVSLDFTGFEGVNNTVDMHFLTPVAPYDLVHLGDEYIHMPEIVVKKGGKPYISGCHNFNFSISHSGNLAAILVSEKECGMDLQEFTRLSEAMYNRVLSKEEKDCFEGKWRLHFEGNSQDEMALSSDKQDIHQLGKNDVIQNVSRAFNRRKIEFEGNKSGIFGENTGHLEYFFRCWSAKESYMKMTGRGLALDPSDVNYDMNRGVISNEGEIAECKTGVFYYKDTKYSVGVCYKA